MITPAIAQMIAAAIRIRMKLRWMPMSCEIAEATSTWILALKKNAEPNHPTE